MVTNHYRWDFIGLSTDEKPTPATSEKVTNGSTFYCSDNSKLYVWYKNQWYERKALGGGGGGGSYTAGEGIDITDDTISVDTNTIQPKLTAGSNVTISGSTISATDTTYSAFTGTDGVDAGTTGLVPAPATTDAGKFLKADGTWDTAGGGSAITTLTTADYNYPENNPNCVALWLLNNGIYRAESNSVNVRVANSSIESLGNTWQTKSIYFFVSTNGNNKDIAILHNNQGGNNGYFQAVSNFRIDASTGDRIGTYYSAITQLKNDLDATYAFQGYALDARQGRVIKNYLIKTPYYINITDLPTTGNTATNVNVYSNPDLSTTVTAQYWFNTVSNELNSETQKLVLVDTSVLPANLIFLNPTTIYRPNGNVSSPSTTTKCEMDFNYFDGTAMRTIRMWVDGTADFQFAVV